jgi:hypothetical protein
MWHTITDGNGFWCDRNTVSKLEGLAPRWSSRDRLVVETLFHTDQIFTRVKDRAARAKVLDRILAVDGFILTFSTFFKDVKKLGLVMLPLRELFPISDFFPARDLYGLERRRPPSVQDILLHKYYTPSASRPNQCLVQYSEHDERYTGTHTAALYAYWQLCLFLMRQEQGTWRPPKKGKDQKEMLDSPDWIINLGQLSRKLGFKSDKILTLCGRDPSLAQIRLHMYGERPSSLYYSTVDDFNAEAHSRKQGQEIFKRRPPSPAPMMTTDADTSKYVPKFHRGLFLPCIWNALAQEARHALTDFGKLLLVLISFFGDFGSSEGSRDQDVTGTELSSPCLRSVENRVEQNTLGNPAGSPSIYSVSDTPQAQASALRSSTTYSIPDYPVSREEVSLTSTGKNMNFWRLSTTRHTQPILEYTCNANKDEIKQVVNKIPEKGVMPSFTMLDKDGRLKLCPPSDLYQRRKRSKAPQDVYLVYGKHANRIWITKELPKSHPLPHPS